MRTGTANKQAAANPAMTPQLQSRGQWRGLAEPGRWSHGIAIWG